MSEACVMCICLHQKMTHFLVLSTRSGKKTSRNFSSMLVRENGHQCIDTYRIDLILKPKELRLMDLQLLCFEFSQKSIVELSTLEGSERS